PALPRCRRRPGSARARDAIVRTVLPIQDQQEMTMRVMVIIKSNKDIEAGQMPDERLLTEMGNFNEQLVKAGVLLGMEGLHPSAKGARVKITGSKRTVTDGPFTESKELIAGYWIWRV